MSGAYTFETRSVATVELQGSVIGVGGFGSPTTSYAFTVRDILTATLATPGVRDVGATNLKFVVASANANCENPGECEGFIARAGTFEVLGTAPYRARFDVTDIVAFDGSSSSAMPPIAGSISGCLHAAP